MGPPSTAEPIRAVVAFESMETVEAAARWARVWHDAWQAQDTDAVVMLYAPGARFSTQAFREPHRGQEGVRQYVEQAFSEERDPRVWVGEPIVTADRAAIEWWAAVVENGVVEREGPAEKWVGSPG